MPDKDDLNTDDEFLDKIRREVEEGREFLESIGHEPLPPLEPLEEETVLDMIAPECWQGPPWCRFTLEPDPNDTFAKRLILLECKGTCGRTPGPTYGRGYD